MRTLLVLLVFVDDLWSGGGCSDLRGFVSVGVLFRELVSRVDFGFSVIPGVKKISLLRSRPRDPRADLQNFPENITSGSGSSVTFLTRSTQDRKFG